MIAGRYAYSPLQAVHLVKESDQSRTLCGAVLNDAWTVGGTTSTGGAITCSTCRKMLP